MSVSKRAQQESPRDFKHLAIHILVGMGFLVFSNIAAKDTIDLVVGMPKERELRTASIRIKTSSFQKRKEHWGWYFSEDTAQYSIEKTPFFYIFCLEKKEKLENTLISEPVFVVVSSAKLKSMTSTYKDGNYAIEISENQVTKKSGWIDFINNFKQIRNALEGSYA
jgi:hypothetical protein